METFCDILKVIGSNSERPTHIMYRANLSWTAMQGCIRTLEKNEIVTSYESEGKRLYRLTEKGFTLLKQYASIRENLSLNSDEE